MGTEFPIIDVSHWVVDRVEQMGSKPKLWLVDSRNQRWLFKQSRPGTSEDWSEKLGAEFAEVLGIPHAHVELAVFDNAPGVVSRDFISNRRTAQLVHGNELIAELVDAAYPAKGKTYGVSQHTVDRVLNVLTRPDIEVPADVALPSAVSRPSDLFVGYLMLDALIRNTDRHHENWAVIDFRPLSAVSLRRQLAPTFDHASCLGRELTDRRRNEALTTNDKNRTVAKYVEKMRSAFYRNAGDSTPLHPFDAFCIAADRHKPASDVWLQKISEVTMDGMKSIVASVPEDRMSSNSRDFCLAVLELTKKSLIARDRDVLS